MDDLTKRRLEHNEQLFREINEAREKTNTGGDDAVLGFVCECADRECTAQIALSAAEYQRIRESPDRYLVLPGHEIPGLERIVEERGAFEVVEKDAA